MLSYNDYINKHDGRQNGHQMQTPAMQQCAVSLHVNVSNLIDLSVCCLHSYKQNISFRKPLHLSIHTKHKVTQYCWIL